MVRVNDLTRRDFGAAAITLAVSTGLGSSPAAAAEKVVRIGLTAPDIPRTHGQPDQAFEGIRVAGLTMYDALTAWDYQSGTRIQPVLATEWSVNPNEQTKWVFKLRSGVKFHDGSPFNADVVVWNVDKILNKRAPQYDPSQAGQTISRMPTLRNARKLDDSTVELTTSEPDSLLPFNLVNLFFASPTRWKAKYDSIPAAVSDAAQRSAQAWDAFSRDPSGTGSFRFSSFVPRQSLEMVRNPDYWDQSRLVKIDRLSVVPLPDVNARVSALLAKQLDWIEAPAPDALDAIKSRGYKIVTSEMAHVWPWQPSLLSDSAWRDKRVRQAANLCVDREGLVVLNGGLAEPASGMLRPNNPWFGKPQFKIRYDLQEARRLMKEAGYSDQKRMPVKVITTQAGSGQMQCVPMNEYLQQTMAQCYFDVTIEVLEWGALFANWREGPHAPNARGANTTNVSIATMDPFFALARFADSHMAPPVSNNWGFINDPELDRLTRAARTTFEPTARDAALARIHERLVDEAMFLWFVHDVAPRALDPKITGYSAPNGFYVDWAAIDVAVG